MSFEVYEANGYMAQLGFANHQALIACFISKAHMRDNARTNCARELDNSLLKTFALELGNSN
jgi:hypothetical protein